MSTNIYKKNLVAAVCRMVAGEVAVTSVAASGFVETAIWPLEKRDMNKNKTELDWTPAEEPVVLETEVSSDEDTIGVVDSEDEFSSQEDEIVEDESGELSYVPGEVLDRVQEMFGEPEDMESSELDMENNWFHGLSVRDLDTLAEDRTLVKNLGELNAWIREYKENSWLMRRKKDGEFTPLALESIAQARKLDVDILDWQGDHGAWDMAVQVFGLRLVKLLGALRKGMVPLDSTLGKVRVDWTSDRPMQKMGQKPKGETVAEYYHTSPLMEGVLHPNFNQIAYFADKAAGRYLGEGVFDGIGGQDLDTTDPALEPDDAAGKWAIKRKMCLTIPYKWVPMVVDGKPSMNAEGKPMYHVLIQDHFLVKETFQDDDGKYKVRRVPGPALNINFAESKAVKVEKVGMVCKNGRIVKGVVKQLEFQPEFGQYVSIWEKLDALRAESLAARKILRSSVRGSEEFVAAYATKEKVAYWMKEIRKSFQDYSRGASIPQLNHLYKEINNGTNSYTGLVVRVNYRNFKLEFTSEDEVSAKKAGVYHAWKKAMDAGKPFIVRWTLFSPLSNKDLRADIQAVREEVLAKVEANQKSWEDIKSKKAQNRRNKGPRQTSD